MTQRSFSTDWLKKLSDPYALLGVSVSSDDRRITKRYYELAKTLHPDSDRFPDPAHKDLANQLFAHLISPAYQKLKQEVTRAEALALLRLQVRRLNRQDGCMAPQSEVARQLMQVPVKEADVFYEQAIAQSITSQYQLLSQFEEITHQLNELNLVYLCLKSGEPLIREKRVGLVSTMEMPPLHLTPLAPEDPPLVTYAQRHYQRAEAYMKQQSWPAAVQELREAIKLEPEHSDYHGLIALAYLKQNLTGMATVHFRQALKLNPRNPLALQYAAQCNIKPTVTANVKVYKEPARIGNLFGLFSGKK
jgi:curved DNA-binding protein CbpA